MSSVRERFRNFFQAVQDAASQPPSPQHLQQEGLPESYQEGSALSRNPSGQDLEVEMRVETQVGSVFSADHTCGPDFPGVDGYLVSWRCLFFCPQGTGFGV